MADVNANIGVHIDTSATIAQLKALRAEISRFNQSVIKSSASAAIAQRDLQTNLVNAINATGKFHAKMGLIRTSTESFTHALETNKLSMREYFRYAGGASTTFRKLFTKEFDTISQVAADRVKRMQTQYIKLGRDASGAMKAISITPTTLNMKDYGTQVAMAAQRQALLNQLLKQGSTNLLNFGKNTQWAGRQLMVGFTVPLAYLGTSAAKTFMAIEEQVVKFKRVYGEMFTTSDQTNKALEDVRRLAEEFTKYGIAVEKTIELAAKAAATGKMGADLTAQVAEATRLAVLGGVEQEQALDTTISLTNAFGIAAADLSKKIDFLNAVENQTVVSIEDLTIAIPKAGPVVQQLGGSVEDLAFFLTAMKEGGINASEGANALKSGLASLINPTDKASKMLADFGINIKGIVEANKGNVRGVVLDFAAALDTLDPLNRARAIEQLFGKFQFARLSTLFSNVSKEGTQASRVLTLATASVEELAIISERELGAVEDAIGTNFKEAVQKLRLALEPIGKEFLKAVTPIAETIGRLLDKFNNLGDGTKKFIVIATTLVGVIGPTFLMTFGLLANAVANIIKLFTTMRGGFLKLKGGSAVLAEQTNYLTKEQMEATTVAAALDQAHNRLTQRFTSEAVALQKLRAAFDSASASQARFAATNPGMMIPGFKGAKKFNFGTMKVPGYAKGTDTVPAMLTPGEAVIPADIAQDERFKPIIQALVTGDLPGYQDGTEGVGKQSGRKLKQTVFFDFDDTLARSTSAIEQWKAERGITGKTTPEMYDAFNKDVVAGRKVPIIQENIDKLKRLQAAGVDVRILTARTANETNLESLKKVLASNGVVIQDSKIQLNNTGDTDAKFKASHIKGFLKDNPDSRAQLIDDKIENVKAVRALSSAKDMSKRFGAVVTSAAVEPAEFVKMKDGVLGVKFQGRTYPVGENEAKAKAVVTKLNDELAAQKSQEGRIKTANWATNRFGELVDARDKGRLISTSRIWRKERGRGGITYAVRKELNDLAGGSSYENLIKARQSSEQKLVMQALEDYQKRTGKVLTPKQIEQALQIQASHVWPSKDETGRQLKFDDQLKWKRGHVFDDLGILNNYLNRTGTTRTGQPTAFQKVADAFLQDDEFTKQSGLNKQQLYKDLEWARQNKQPTTMQELQSIKRLAELDQIMSNAGVYTNKSVIDRLGIRGVGNLQSLANGIYQAEVSGKLVAARGPEWAKGLAARILDLASMKSVAKGGAPLAEYDFAVARGERIKSTAGSRTVTGATGRKKPASTKAVGPSAGPKDTRLITSKGVKSITPVRVGRFAYGAEGGFGDQRVAGSTTAQEIARERRISLNEAKKLLAQERKLAEARAAGTNITEESGKATSQKTELDKKQMRQMRQEKLSRIGTPLSMAAGTAAMAGAMMGAGESFNKLMFAVSGVSAILPLLANPVGAAVAGIAALGLTIYNFNATMNKARKEGYEYGKSLTMTKDKLIELSKLTGAVTPEEIASRRRESRLAGTTDAQRKTGQTLLESDFGKGILSSIEQQGKLGAGSEQIASNLATQLSSAVLRGAITTEQARSLAMALGEKLKNYNIPTMLAGELVTILGPNGERVEDEPLQVALEVSKRSFEQTTASFQEAIGTGFFDALNIQAARKKQVSESKSGLDKFAYDTMSSALNPIGAYFQIRDAAAEQNKLKAAAVQLGIQEIQQQQGIRDSLNAQYDSEISKLEAQKLATTDKQKQLQLEKEIEALQAKRKTDLDTLNNQFQTQINQLVQMKDQIGQANFDKAIKASADAMYKEGPMAVFKDQALAALSTLENSDFKTYLQLEFASGTIDPITLTTLANNKELATSFNVLVSTTLQGDAAEAALILGLIGKTGADDQTKKYIIDIINKNPKEAKDNIAALETLASLSQKYGISLDMKFSGERSLKQVNEVTDILDELFPGKKEITKKEVETIFSDKYPEQSAYVLDNWKTLVGDSDTITREMILNLNAYVNDPNALAAYMAAKGITVSKVGSTAAGHVTELEGKAAQRKAQDAAYIVGTGKGSQGSKKPTGGGGGGAGGGTRDTTLDELLKRLKFIRKASINAEGGVKELLKVTSGKGLTKFGGVIQQLAAGPQGGFNREFISFLEGMDNATRKTYMTIKNGQVILTKQGKALKEAFNEKVIGEYQVAQFQAVQDTKAQGAALAKLKAAGVDSATALEMVADANLAVAINSKNISSAELKNMATQAQEAKDAVEQLNLALKQQSIDSTKQLADSKTTLEVLTKIRQLQPNVSQEIMDYISSNPAFAKSLADAFKGASNNLAEIQNIINNIPEQKTINIKIALQQNPIAELERQLSGIGEKMTQYFNAKRNIISKPFLDQIVPIDKRITGLNTQIVGAEINLNNAKKALNPFETQIAGIESTIAQKRLDIETGIEQEIKAQSNKVESIKKQIENQFDKTITSLEDAIKTRQRDIELTFDRPIEVLQEESSDLSNELTLMDRVAESINKKYDEQAAALQKVADINQEISDQQKGQLDLAGALSRGDVAAAAQAAQEMRAQAAARAKERTSGVIEAARQAELGGLRSATGMTRVQIEERQFQISQQIFALEEQKEAASLAIRNIEDQIYNLQEARAKMVKEVLVPEEEKLVSLQNERAAKLEEIEKLELDILKIKQSPEYKKAIADVEAAEKALDALQQQLKDAQLEKSKIEADMAKALEDLDLQQKNWEDVQTGIDNAKGSMVNYNTELDKAKKIAKDLQNYILGIGDAEAGFTVPGTATKTPTGTATGLDEFGLDPKDPDYQEKRRARQGIGMGAPAASATGTNKISLAKQLADNTKLIADSTQKIKDLETEIQRLTALNVTNSTGIKDNTTTIYDLEVKRVLEVEKIKTYINEMLPILIQNKDVSLLINDNFNKTSISTNQILEYVKNIVGILPTKLSLWTQIKDAIVGAVSSIQSYISNLQSALSVASQLSSMIASLNRTVVTTHIINTVYTSSGSTGPTGPTGPNGPTGPSTPITPNSPIFSQSFMYGGKIKPMSMGGKVGSDTVPAMLTPGEFIVNKASTKAFTPFLTAINESKYPSILAKNISNARPIYQIPIQTSLSQPSYNISSPVFSASPTNIASAAYNDNSSSVYNYSVEISVGSTNASPDTIAKAVMNEIKYLDSQRVRSQKVS